LGRGRRPDWVQYSVGMPQRSAVDGSGAELRRIWRSASVRRGQGSTADAVYGVLSEAIVKRVLPSGWRLGEERLAGLLGISRTPIREALTRLLSANLVARDERGTMRVEYLTVRRALEVYVVRGSLESLSARLAAGVADPVSVLQLEHLNSLCAEAARVRDFEAMARHNIEFHEAVARTSRNEMLIQFIDQTYNWVKMTVTTTLTEPNRAETAVQQHADLIKAIAARDQDGAERIAKQHMSDAEKIRIAMLGRRPGLQDGSSSLELDQAL
jgi:DNA-binding GntR family transcriptional regulator